MPRTAVILLNLGGPDQLSSVQPFLQNLFRDPAIIRLPWIFREILAWVISRSRLREAQKIYAYLGGGSPLLKNTQIQSKALEKALGKNFRVFIAMRYWYPFTQETITQVMAYQPDDVVLLPLYPQFSTTTTASSLKCWIETASKMGLNIPTKIIGCYPTAEGFIQAISELLEYSLQEFEDLSQAHILFSAHGLPKRIVESGDPYQTQVEQTARAVINDLKIKSCSYSIAYQSRVGPLEWIGPATETEIRRLGREKKNILLVPLSFVSEHSETLYEIDYHYKILAEKSGVRKFLRVPTVGIHPKFMGQMVEFCHQKNLVENFICSTDIEKCICREVMKKSV